MNFDFYFKRTSFRTMTVYFKQLFKPYFDKWKSNKKKGLPVESAIADFMHQYFPGLLDKFAAKVQTEVLELVKLLVFTHRHNKNDPFLADPLVDFGIVREPMYKYSRVAQDKFFDYPVYSFFFAWFSINVDAKNFA